MNVPSMAALDVGGGTQDFLLWRRDEPIENALKMVLPSPTRVVASRLDRAREAGRDVWLTGWLMGGGAMDSAVRRLLEAGLKVYATPASAASLNDNLAKVEAKGVIISQDRPDGALPIFTTDLDLVGLSQALAGFEVAMPPSMAVAVCDHGYSPGYSNRIFRFEQWLKFLEAGGEMRRLIFDNPPAHMTRMHSISQQKPGVLLMDTAAAALWGALEDPTVAARRDQGLCVVNVGNMHTVAFLAVGEKVLAIYEHHTGCLNTKMLEEHIQRFIAGSITGQEVFDTQGHGCARLADAPSSVAGPIVVTGPQREMARDLPWQVAAPGGDTMLSGCFGLIAAARDFLGG